MGKRVLSVDTETTGLALHHGCQPFFVSTHDQDGKFRKWEWDVDPFTRRVKITNKDRVALAKYLAGAELVFHHAKFDIRALTTIDIWLRFPKYGWDTRVPEPPYVRLHPDRKNAQIVVCPDFHDTIFLSHIHSSQGTGAKKGFKHKLKDLAVMYLGISDKDEKELHKHTVTARNVGRKLGWDVHEDVQADYWMPRQVYSLPEYRDEKKLAACGCYAEGDTYRAIGLWYFFSEMIDQDKQAANKWKAYDRERELLPVVYKMETHGFPLNPDNTVDLIDEFGAEYETKKAEANAILKKALPNRKVINVQSDFCLREYFFDKCKLKPSFLTPTGMPSCKKEYLEELRDQKLTNETKKLLDLIIGYTTEDEEGEDVTHSSYKNYKKAAEFLHGFIEKSLLDRSGILRLHSSLNQAGTGTTRFSSNDPNGQNIPTRSSLRVRRAFAPPPGKIWYALDYSQLQLRIFASVSGEQAMVQAFIDGHDFHTFTSEKTGIVRKTAKNVNFAMIFGAGEPKIDATAGKKGTYKLVGDTFPNVPLFIEESIKLAKRDGFILTEFGYPLDVPSDTSYKAANYRIQGTEGDIVKNAMIAIDHSGLVDWNISRIVFQVHDELIFETDAVGRDETDSWALQLAQLMEKAGADLGIWTPVDTKVIETNWDSGTKIPTEFVCPEYLIPMS
jgi:DNA polymerase I-like protein with 3'-5' exonuclease and polymerase domains